MTERRDDVRRPFDLDETGEPYPEPPAQPERAPWESAEPVEQVPAYAAEDAVEDVEDDVVEEEEAPAPLAVAEPAYEPEPEPDPAPEPEPEPDPEVVDEPEPEPALEHAAAGLDIPDGYRTLQGEAHGDHLAVAVVVSRFNGKITNRLLERALNELERSGVARDAVTIAAVPGAFELPLAAMALAKTRRYACVVALGCIIRGETKHFDFIASEAASGLQLAALETGTPVSFGVLTCENREQAEARIDRADDAVRSALEMADMFSKLRAAAG
jgi:6,7-dimethyl-8-ribityllumazine synthase